MAEEASATKLSQIANADRGRGGLGANEKAKEPLDMHRPESVPEHEGFMAALANRDAVMFAPFAARARARHRGCRLRAAARADLWQKPTSLRDGFS
jgi:hypothetical protein